ncbi:ras-related protein Rab-7L1-like isoform X2 [Acanthaster planci]|uniref:Ras-related protein Rab-7L1-like isoform X2 n=1 Tax=Acanthaster planci TaxID=133434 RepID=A0A8B7XLP5_ACAPL|nr:ras-related protein Rab-7L1-like isoform X2 [Acanthaster planci]
MTEKYFKVLIIGDPRTGKTSFMRRYVGHQFTDNYIETQGCDFGLKRIRRSPTELVGLHIWDIAGQDAFRHLTRVFYRSASAAVVMFDLTSRRSFEHVKEWKQDLDAKVAMPDGSPVPCLLLGNKSDLDQYVVTDEEITLMSQDLNFVGWSKISVKDYVNIDQPMLFLVDVILARCYPTFQARRRSDPEEIDAREFADSIELSPRKEDRKTSTSCFCFY